MEISTHITRVLPPRRREDVLTRQRLLNRLYDLVDRKLILVSAPAGYGKTTLLADFAADLAHPVCWYTLGHTDRDPRLFLERLVSSLRYRFPDLGTYTLRALDDNPDLSGGAPDVVRTLVDEIAEVVPHWFVLVLDDYHRLGNAREIDAILGRLVDVQADRFLLIAAGRSVPDLPFAVRLVARGEVGGIGQQELRFRADEIQSLLAQNNGLRVSEQEAEKLAVQSEGWITGILLTAHATHHDVLHDLVRAHASDQPVYEYLAREVFEHQEPAIQAFLIASSTLEEMNLALCEEALGLKDVEYSLALLEKRNLFVTRLEGEWYRYHRLFRDYLQLRSRRGDELWWGELHRRAARWFEMRGQPEPAVDHYLAASDHENAARVMTAVAQGLFYAGHLETLSAWGAALPDSLRDRTPRLALFQSRAIYKRGEWEEALALTAVAEHGYRRADDGQGLAYALLQRCEVWQGQARFREALTLAREVLSLIERSGAPAAYEAHRILGQSYLALGQLEKGEIHFRQALVLCREHGQGSQFELSSVLSGLANCLWQRGHLAEAISAQRQAVDACRRMDHPVEMDGVLNDLGFYLYLAGEYDEALQFFEQALAIARRSGNQRSEALTLVSLSELYRDTGACERADEACGEGVSIADELGYGFLSIYGREAQALVRRCQGRYSQAETTIAEAVGRAELHRLVYQANRCRVTLGLIQIEGAKVQAGLANLARASERLAGIGAVGELARARFFTSWGLFRDGRDQEAVVVLRRMLDVAPASAVERLFAVEGERFSPLLERAVAEGVEEVDMLLARTRARGRNRMAVFGQSIEVCPQREELRIYAFGRGRVERGGEEVPLSAWEAASARQLLFYLLVHPPRPRDQIASALWPELAPRKVKATFHTAKFRLNRALGREALSFDGQRYRISPQLEYRFDVVAFERLLDGTGPERRVEQLQQAVALYRGSFLEDVYADWCVPVREALHERYLDALDELARRLLTRRQVRPAIKALHRGLEEDELRENFYRGLMIAYALLGQRGQALTQYRRCADALERELGVSPSFETTALYRRIVDELPLDQSF